MPRYKMIPGSQSAHCCFEASVVDTERSVKNGDGEDTDRFEIVCECFAEGMAMQIADALNKDDL
jgi:hypothetical protein